MKVAIWVNNFGNAKHIAHTLNSIMRQSFTDWKCFIFDNHSTDGAVDIIHKYTSTFPQLFEKVPMPPGLAGIPAMRYAWENLDALVGYEYSITLGGHDYFQDNDHLQILVERAEHETRAGNTIALIYCDTWQVDEEDKVVGRFNNIMQSGGNMPLPLVPQWVVSGIDCPPFFGLWNEKIRRQVPVRHECAGFDHLVVAHAACKGLVLWEPRCVLRMRAPGPGASMENYGKRHLSPATLAAKDKDFIDQLEWVTAMVDEVCKANQFSQALLTASMFATYAVLRGYNLSAISGGIEAFNANPAAQKALGACYAANAAVRELIKPSQP